jgi:hypothetical protein
MAEISEEEKEYLEQRARLLLRLLEEISRSKHSISLLTPEVNEDSELSGRLATLVDFYLSEVRACLGALAFLSANVSAVATFEAFLLMKCLSERTKVSRTRKWQSLQGKNKPKPFATLLLKMHFRDLLTLGDELSWFPKDGVAPSFQQKLAALFGETAAKGFSTPSNSALTFSEFASAASTELRNLLHPGCCARIKADRKETSFAPVELVS